MIKTHDHVKVKKEFPFWGINIGEIGFVVGLCGPRAYFVEFPDSGPIVLPLTEDEIEIIHGN